MKKNFYGIIITSVFLFLVSGLKSQSAEFMMQGWYWDYPKTVQGANWADTLRLKAAEIGDAGFTFLWFPPLSRTASGGLSNGYDPKDLFDYGISEQGATGFGTENDVGNLISALNTNSIKAVADMVYNHRNGGSVQDNPGLKNYIVNFYTNLKADEGANPFPYDRMRVVLPLGGGSGNGAGDYYFKFRSRSQHSKFYNWEYKIYMSTDKVGWQGLPDIYEAEPNGGGDCNQGCNEVYLGRNILGNIDSDACGIDEFKLTLTVDDFNAGGDAIYIYFDGRNSGYSDLYIHGIWSVPRNANIVNDLYYQTYTDFSWAPSKRGKMDWSYFKPNTDRETYLAGDWDNMYFYYDYDQFQNKTRDTLFAWTRWNWSNIGIRGFRLDAVKHFSPEFVGDLLDNLYENGMSPTMVVGEWYSTNVDELAGWVNSVYYHMNEATKEAIKPRIFDFSLREALRRACDDNNYDVRNVFNAGIVDQNKLYGSNVVTFVNNHDFRDQSGFASLIQNDAILAYAYILTNNQIGLPTVFYPDYFGYPSDAETGYQSYHPTNKGSLKNQINKLMSIHNQYIYGANSRIYLNNFTGGRPNSLGENNNSALVYQIKGTTGNRDIVVAINFSDSQIGFSQEIDGVAMGTQFEDLTGNAIYKTPEVENANGINNSIWISLPARSYAVYRVGSWGLWNAQRSYAGFNVKGNSVSRTFWDEGTGNIQEYDFGTFIGSDIFQLTSYDIKTWKKSGADVTGGNLFYTIYPKGQRPQSPVFISKTLNWMEDIGGQATGDQKWGFSGQSINLLNGLTSGEYTIEFYAQMDGTNPNKSEYDSNNGLNYKAYFRYNYVRSFADGNWSSSAIWLDQIIPDSSVVSAEINHNINLTEDISVNDLLLFGGSLTVAPAKSLTVFGTSSSALDEAALLLQSNEFGTASLLHNTSGLNATVQRYIPAADWDEPGDGWHLVASPVIGQPIDGVWTPTGQGNDYDFYQWNEPNVTWLNQKENANQIVEFETGRGYFAAYQQLSTKAFAGPLQVTAVTVNLTKTGAGGYYGWNLLGNPFTTALDWSHSSWERNVEIGGIAKIWSNGAYIDIDESEPVIPSANGFFVFTNADDTELTIPAGARIHSNQNWYKLAGNRVLLTARHESSDMVQRTVIKENPNATDGFDLKFDSRFMAGYAPMFYSMADDEKLSTNTLPKLNHQTAIPLQFIANKDATYEIELVETFYEKEAILIDLKLNLEHKFSVNPVYSFSASPYDDPERFILYFGSLGIENQYDNESVWAWYSDDQLFLITDGTWHLVNVFDIQGRSLLTKAIMGESFVALPFRFAPGLYVLQLSSGHMVKPVKLLVR